MNQVGGESYPVQNHVMWTTEQSCGEFRLLIKIVSSVVQELVIKKMAPYVDKVRHLYDCVEYLKVMFINGYKILRFHFSMHLKGTKF